VLYNTGVTAMVASWQRYVWYHFVHRVSARWLLRGTTM
jgi:hypothetical protein